MRLVISAAMAAILAGCNGNAISNTAMSAVPENTIAPVASPAATPSPTPSPSPTPTPVNRAMMIGNWVDRPEACRGDTATQYSADGTWMDDSNLGTWSLDGDRLTIVTTQAYELGGDSDEPQTLASPETARWTVKLAGKNHVTYSGYGKRFTLVKCP